MIRLLPRTVSLYRRFLYESKSIDECTNEDRSCFSHLVNARIIMHYHRDKLRLPLRLPISDLTTTSSRGTKFLPSLPLPRWISKANFINKKALVDLIHQFIIDIDTSSS